VGTELAEAFEALSAACARVAKALRAAELKSAKVASAETTEPRARKPARVPAVVTAPARKAPARRRILVALAQFGRPMSAAQIGAYTGLAHKGGAFVKELARLRAEGCVEGPGGAVRITSAGLEELGDFEPLPIGIALFEFWCSKLGTTAEQILRALRRLEHASLDELGAETGLACRGGAFTKALAQLRKMELIVGRGSGMSLAPAFKAASAPTVGVFDTSSGKSVKIDARTGTVRQ